MREKSALNRLEHAPSGTSDTRYHKIRHDGTAIKAQFIDLSLDAHGPRGHNTAVAIKADRSAQHAP